MKKIFLLFAFVAIITIGRAQTPSFSVATNNIAITMGANDYYTDTVVVSNLKTGSDLELEWTLNNITINTDWVYQMCDHSQCILLVTPGTNQPNSGVHDPVALKPGENSFFKIILNSAATVESAVVEIAVWEKGNRNETEQTILYDVNNATSITEEAFDRNIQVFPTQVNQHLYLAAEEGRLDRGTVSILDLQGRILQAKSVTPVEMMDFQVGDLESGMYLVRYETEKQVVSRKFLKR